MTRISVSFPHNRSRDKACSRAILRRLSQNGSNYHVREKFQDQLTSTLELRVRKISAGAAVSAKARESQTESIRQALRESVPSVASSKKMSCLATRADLKDARELMCHTPRSQSHY